jgi:hypothetical protein
MRIVSSPRLGGPLDGRLLQLALQGGQPRLVDLLDHGHDHGQPGLQAQITFFQKALQHDRAVRVDLLDFPHVGHVRQGQVLGHAGAHLPRVAVDGLAAHQDQVRPTQLADPRRQGEGGGQGIRAGEGPVAQEHRLVRAQTDGLAQGGLHLGRPHGEHGQLAAVLLLQAHPFLQGVGVEGVDDRGHPLAHQGVGLGIDAHVGGVRNLLDADHDVQGRYSFFCRLSLISCRAMTSRWIWLVPS